MVPPCESNPILLQAPELPQTCCTACTLSDPSMHTVTARVPWLTSFCPTPQAGGGQLGAVRSYLTWEKTNVERRSCSPPSLSQRDGISKKGHSHALLVLGMALASAVWFAFPDFQGTSVAHFILPQQKQNILASNQAKEGRTCLWGSGKSKRADERSGRQLCIEHLLEQRPN